MEKLRERIRGQLENATRGISYCAASVWDGDVVTVQAKDLKEVRRQAVAEAMEAMIEEMQRRDGGTTEEGYKPEEHHDTEEEYQWAHGYDTAQKEWITELEQARSELLKQQ